MMIHVKLSIKNAPLFNETR